MPKTRREHDSLGTIEVPADSDVFQFTAKTSEPVLIDLAPAAGSTLNTTLSVTDSLGNSYQPVYFGSGYATRLFQRGYAQQCSK